MKLKMNIVKIKKDKEKKNIKRKIIKENLQEKKMNQ